MEPEQLHTVAKIKHLPFNLHSNENFLLPVVDVANWGAKQPRLRAKGPLYRKD